MLSCHPNRNNACGTRGERRYRGEPVRALLERTAMRQVREENFYIFTIYFCYSGALIALATCLAENLFFTLRGTPHEDLRGIASGVVTLSFCTVFPIPLVYFGVFIGGRGLRRRLIPYILFGMLFWYFQLIAVSFEFAT
jgi:hypothetical protein